MQKKCLKKVEKALIDYPHDYVFLVTFLPRNCHLPGKDLPLGLVGWLELNVPGERVGLQLDRPSVPSLIDTGF